MKCNLCKEKEVHVAASGKKYKHCTQCIRKSENYLARMFYRAHRAGKAAAQATNEPAERGLAGILLNGLNCDSDYAERNYGAVAIARGALIRVDYYPGNYQQNLAYAQAFVGVLKKYGSDVSARDLRKVQ